MRQEGRNRSDLVHWDHICTREVKNDPCFMFRELREISHKEILKIRNILDPDATDHDPVRHNHHYCLAVHFSDRERAEGNLSQGDRAQQPASSSSS